MTRTLILTALAMSMALAAVSQTSGNQPAVPAAATGIQPANAAPVAAHVPHLVRFTGTLERESDSSALAVAAPGEGGGIAARSSSAKVVGMTFTLYSQQSGGVPLWSEVQNVQVDESGNYSVELGATKPDGLPMELFSSAQAQWLGVRREGEAELPRVMLFSVPYALKAADAETFGGKPPSAYLPASSSGTAGATAGAIPPASAKQPLSPSVGGSGTTNYVALWTSSTNLGTSAIYESSSHNLGIGTTSPTHPLVVQGHSTSELVEVQQTASSGLALLGFASSSNGGGVGVEGKTFGQNGTGVEGVATATSGAGFGVSGTSASTSGVGLSGEATSTSGSSIGAQGTSASTSGTGVLGEVDATSGSTFGVIGRAASPDGVAVQGLNTSTSGNAPGVYGKTSSSSGVAVAGSAEATSGVAVGVIGQTTSTDGYGMIGKSVAGSGSTYGVAGEVASDEGVAVYGEGLGASMEGSGGGYRPVGVWGDTSDQDGVAMLATADDSLALAGYNSAPGISTARFQNDETSRIDSPIVSTHSTHYGGTCLMDVSGNLACNGSKSAVVPVDGGARQVALYAVEAPENWFEDAGSARLSRGAVTVSLEPTFAQTVNGSLEYHVFLTPKGDCKGLYVTNETAGSFDVRELGGGTTDIAFDYRIMARRKGYEEIRLADNTERFQAIAVEKGRALAKRKPGAVPSLKETPTPVAHKSISNGR